MKTLVAEAEGAAILTLRGVLTSRTSKGCGLPLLQEAPPLAGDMHGTLSVQLPEKQWRAGLKQKHLGAWQLS